MTALIAASTLALLAAGLASVVLIAHRRLRVAEDPRLTDIETILPGINCGACGQPSCHTFAQALLDGDAMPAQCTVSPTSTHSRIAQFLGVAVGTARRRVARLACAGGRNVSHARAHYAGERSCAGATVVGGGAQACRWGCLHFGDCQRACRFAAIRMNTHGLPVVEEAACTACGDCVSACPKDLFRLEPVERAVWVNCSNPEHGDALLRMCAVACTGCGRCAQDAPHWIRMERNLPAVSDFPGNAPRAAIERCPTGAIVWIENGRQQTGAAAAQPLQIRDLPVRTE